MKDAEKPKPSKKFFANAKIIGSLNKVRELYKKKSGAKYLKISGLVILILAMLFTISVGVAIYGFDQKSDFVQTTSKYIPYPAAFVGTSSVRLSEYTDSVYHAKHYYDRTGVDQPENYKSEILDNLIVRRIILAQAKKYGITVTNNEVDAQFKQEVEQYGGEDKAAELLLDLYDFKIRDIKELIRYKMIEDKLREKVPVRVHASHILVAVDSKADKKKVAEAEKLANDLYKKVQGGEAFQTVAKKYSQDTATKDTGGDLGFFEKGQFVKEFEEVAFRLKIGEISKPVKTEFGYHIIKVTERKGEVSKTFEQWLLDIKEQTKTIKLIKI
jgi:hypothetical protein